MTGLIRARDGRGRAVKTLETAERDMRAAEMRSRSMTYPQIAAELGIAVSTAYEAVQRAFATIPTDEASEAKRHELAKLDRLEAHFLAVMEREHIKVDHGKVIRDDETGQRILDDGPGVQAGLACLRVQERRARLMGYDAPQRQVLQVVPQDVVDAEIVVLEAQLADPGGSIAGELTASSGTPTEGSAEES